MNKNSLNQTALKAITATLNYCADEHYTGYSLYDSHNGAIPFGSFGRSVSFYANQIIKRSPLNFRPLLGIKKGINPKGMGLFLYALSELAHAGIDLPGVRWAHGSMRAEMDHFFSWLANHPSEGYKGYAWGYNYDWPKKDGGLVKAYTPSSVVTGFNARAVHAYYRHTKAEEAAKVLKGCATFIINHIPTTETEQGLCFSYIPIKRDITINANLLAAEVLAYADEANQERQYEQQIQKVLAFTLARQNPDGSWYYSHSVETDAPKKQIDFHQGYVLESVYRICTTYGIDLGPYRAMLEAGLMFYLNNQFDAEGRALWRFPKKWPVDIHNQSQGIITFSLMRNLLSDGLGMVSRILSYTLNEMQDAKTGRFYYQKWPFMTARTPYMRWNQGWMVVALTHVLLSTYMQS